MTRSFDQLKREAWTDALTPDLSRWIIDLRMTRGATVNEQRSRVRIKAHEVLRTAFKIRLRGADNESIDQTGNDHTEHNERAYKIAEE
tara:strand:- start:18 stop:281 length:264 start_codon:yes stop_codon:yes gene_type:complete